MFIPRFSEAIIFNIRYKNSQKKIKDSRYFITPFKFLDIEEH